MSGLGKLLFGAAVTGAAAYGVYSFLQKYRVEVKPVGGEDEDADEVAESADFEEKDGENGEEEATESAGGFFDPGKIFNSEKAAEAAGTIREAANRAYTTIQHGSQQAADVVRDNVIPKSSEVVEKVSDVMKDTVIPKGAEVADKVTDVVKETVIPKGQEVIDRVKDAVTGKAETAAAEKHYVSTEIPIQGPEEEKTPDPAPEEAAADEETAAPETEKSETIISETSAESTTQEAEHKPSSDSPKEGTVEFFDDEE